MPPQFCFPPVETNTIECSNAVLCHATWFSFLILPAVAALSRNPLPELGVGSVPLWHEAVTELYLAFKQLRKAFAPSGC
jgi:hypothetical protein